MVRFHRAVLSPTRHSGVAGRSQAGTAFLTIMSQRKKGCESLTYPFPGFNFYICLSTTYTCQDNVSRLVFDSVEAWLSGLKRQFAKLVKSFYRLTQVRILLLPLRVAQFTLLSFDLGIERQTVWSSLYFSWGCHGSIHEPSLSAMIKSRFLVPTCP